ncbi:TrkH family potassium uptake protein [Nitrincola alkalilacustris]|uniref:TrkH family potassium uptake protein n=1 Tax=Nitrincola alkalilacustris TaxID=1571224 RepID=UPI001F0F70E0|nr:TrkH family potassium uptake protein [Nitrincola alkalilacustris]
MFKLFRPLLFVYGVLLLCMSVLMAGVTLFAGLTGDSEFRVFLVSSCAVFVTGALLTVIFHTRRFQLVSRQLYLLTTFSWVIMSLAGALPFYFSHYPLTVTDSIFEAVSGITTTGSTVISGLETLPESLLLWRSLLQWLGGLGVIGMAVSILPFLQVGGMRLFQTESSDWSDKSLPRLQDLARALLLTYLALTLACTTSYWLAGMTPFDAVNHAMTTVSTGGYATDDRSMGRFSPTILWISILFMLLGALPFVMIIGFLRKPSLVRLKDQQARGFVLIVATLALSQTLFLILYNKEDAFDALTQSVFNLMSVITTTGYASADYSSWGTFSFVLFFLATFIGGCSGSTSGGMKIFRFQLSSMFLKSQIHKLIHPSGVFSIRYNQKVVQDDIMLSAVAFSFMFFVALGVITSLLSMFGLDFITSLSGAATALTNVGPGLGDIIGPAGNFQPLPDGAKWLLAFAMILGRLELLTVMVLFTPMFWRG